MNAQEANSFSTTGRQDSPMWQERSLSHSDREAFRTCRKSYKDRKTRAKRVKRETPQFVGDLTHLGTAVDDSAEREKLLSKQLERVPEADREEVEATVRELIANDAAMETEGAVDVQKEKLIRWTDPETGWDLVAKPDSMGFVVDDARDREVLEVVDKKTAYTVKESHIKQLLFFGMVASLSMMESFLGSIKLVARALRGKEEKVLWYSRARTPQNLREVRADIYEIEKSIETDSFPPTTGMHCNRCPFREGCDAFKAWTEQDQAGATDVGEASRRDRGSKGRRPFYLSRRRYA